MYSYCSFAFTHLPGFDLAYLLWGEGVKLWSKMTAKPRTLHLPPFPPSKMVLLRTNHSVTLGLEITRGSGAFSLIDTESRASKHRIRFVFFATGYVNFYSLRRTFSHARWPWEANPGLGQSAFYPVISGNEDKTKLPWKFLALMCIVGMTRDKG